ncbi:MAG: bifunctional riboflavin kinase/FAD synthetase [Firmicutes bacterium]|nr:bifunctional riboflavin kinase/FAD synthetase [Bacillota bacterium]
MQVYRLEDFCPSSLFYNVALGFFDGVHAGHQVLLKNCTCLKSENTFPSLAFTFRNHPRAVLNPRYSTNLLTTFDEKCALLEKTGIDVVVWTEFNKNFSGKSPEAFFNDILIKKLKAASICAGYNYRFGAGGEGHAETLKKFGKSKNLKVEITDAVRIDGRLVSSTHIRHLITTGEVNDAAKFLGRFYSFSNTVKKGKGIGRELGIHTANIKVPDEKVSPRKGVYAVIGKTDDRIFQGAANLGTAPTFGEKEFLLEAHFPGIKEDMYHKRLEISFVARIRDEKKFPSPGLLLAQIREDLETALKILNEKYARV